MYGMNSPTDVRSQIDLFCQQFNFSGHFVVFLSLDAEDDLL